MLDVETTGLSPRSDRVIEVGVVLLDGNGQREHEWTSRINPQGPVGATHIHGITDADVAHAPTFEQLAPHLAGLLHGRALVAHNARFDSSFMRYEFGRANWSWPIVPTLCTLEASWHYMPHLDRRRLVDCCWAAGVNLDGGHSALVDARATAELLGHFLNSAFPPAPLKEHRAILGQATRVPWPTLAGTGRIADPAAPPKPPSRVSHHYAPPLRVASLLETFSLSDALDDGASEASLPYLELLTEALEDGELNGQERAALGEVAELYELGTDGVDRAHRGFMRALARAAIEDGKITRAERRELHAMARLLGQPISTVKDLLDGEEEARLASLSTGLAPLPDIWAHGEPLRVGQRIAFTGCDDAERDLLEQAASQAGVRVLNNVSRRTALLVTDGSFQGGKAEAAAQLGTRLVTPQDFATMLRHIQPHQAPSTRDEPVHSAATQSPAPAKLAPTDHRAAPGVVRTWAIANGYSVGARGRLSREIWEAHKAATA
ncbi:exonuclease domain-containing protein [Pedococcus sp. KACC 23699]|uniref:Exonuclease domain-containing protein n=1 Tax=Pedococcus sp. KACC 23699 TaxID=3149228 RepID=A0AAU7JVX0_9MICO